VIKKLTIMFIVGFVILTVVVAVFSARTGDQRRPSPRVVQTNKLLYLDTSPPRFPNGNA